MSENEMLAARARQVSFLFILGTFVVLAWLNFTMLLLTALFAYFALNLLRMGKLQFRWLSVALLAVLVAAIAYGMGFFVNEARKSLPEIAAKAIPSVSEWAAQYQIELPFTDMKSLKTLMLKTVNTQALMLGSFAQKASMALLFIVVGCFVAACLFLNQQFELDRPESAPPRNLYALCCDEIAARFATFYASFSTVIGAQLLISMVNTAATMVFVFAVGLPYALVVVGATFLCGLLPIVGNLISNTIIIGIGFTVSPKMALAALVFLVTIHKMEYFLNSKIIGGRIRNPIWMTMLGLIIGERLMGIPGMILAPVILHYVKAEMSKVALPVEGESAVESQRPANPI